MPSRNPFVRSNENENWTLDNIVTLVSPYVDVRNNPVDGCPQFVWQRTCFRLWHWVVFEQTVSTMDDSNGLIRVADTVPEAKKETVSKT